MVKINVYPILEVNLVMMNPAEMGPIMPPAEFNAP